MSLDEEYPNTHRNLTARLRALLETVPRLPEGEREDLATALNSMADTARDLDDIVQRLLNEPHTPEEIGELLIAFELTTEQIRGHSDTIDGKLYDIGDRLKAVRLCRWREVVTGVWQALAPLCLGRIADSPAREAWGETVPTNRVERTRVDRRVRISRFPAAIALATDLLSRINT